MEITKEQMEAIVGTVLSAYEKEKRTEEKRERDRRLRNTKLLLRNYHSFKRYADQHQVDEVSQEESPIQELILNSQDIVSSIRVTTERTIIMVQHLNNALKALQYICEQEEQEDKSTSKQYDILSKRFLEQRAIEEIAVEYNLNERTIYKLIDSASERLSVLLFGVYGLKIE